MAAEEIKNEFVINAGKFDIIFEDGKGLANCTMLQGGRFHHLVQDDKGRKVLVNKGAVKYYVVKSEK